MKKTAIPNTSRLLIAACVAFMGVTNAMAVPVTYKDRAAFDAAVAAISGVGEDTLNFDGTAAGTIFPSGSAHQGVTFTYSLSGGYEIGVDNYAPGTSGTNTLKVSNDSGSSFGNFALGDVIDFGFGASHAFGMYIILDATSFYADDVNLTFGGITLSNLDSDVATLVGSNSVPALFVGIVDSAATYTSANLRFGAVGASSSGYFEIDDIVKTSSTGTGGTVPEPATLALLGIGLMGLGALRRRGSR